MIFITLQKIKGMDGLFIIKGENMGLFPNCHTYLYVQEDILVAFDPQCGYSSLEKGLKKLGRSMKNSIDFIVNSHFHIDHCASNAIIKKNNPNVDILIHKEDFEALASFEEYFRRYGLPEHLKDEYLFMLNHSGYEEIEADRIFMDGDVIPGGFKVEHTPGHTPGHSSFYKSRFLIAGDMDCTSPWLGNITSNAGDFLKSVRRLIDLDIGTLLPCHGSPIYGKKNVLEQLVQYKEKFLAIENKILTLVDQTMLLEKIVAKRTNEKSNSRWKFSPMMRHFRKIDTLSYLIHLEEIGKLHHFEEDGNLLWEQYS